MDELTGQAGEQVNSPHLLTLSEAATACGVSRSRIRRMLDAGAFPNAVQEGTPGKGTSAQVWHVPVPDLLAAGLTPNKPRPMFADRGPGAGDLTEQDSEQRLVQALHDLDVERERRKAAESVVQAQARALDGLELALRLLEARSGPDAPVTRSEGIHGDSHTPEGAGMGETTQSPQADAQAGNSWWARLRDRMK